MPTVPSPLSDTAGKWVTVTVTRAAQAWVQNAAANYGLVLLQQSASGSVYAAFCSELGWSPCSASLRPRLTITYTMPTSLTAYEAEAQPLAPAAVVVTKYYYLGSTRVATPAPAVAPQAQVLV